MTTASLIASCLARRTRLRGGLVAVALALLVPATAGATVLQPLGALPPDSGDKVQIANVSEDGQRLLLVASDPGTVWSIDASTKSPSKLASSPVAPLAGQSPSGTYDAWIARHSLTACAHAAYVAAAGAPLTATKVTLPSRYAHAAMDAVAVADDGTVTVGVTPCGDPIRHLAVLTAGPGQGVLAVRAAYRGGTPFQWQISQNGRVFAGCGTVSRHGKRMAQLSLLDSRSPARVRTARVVAERLPFCVASDAGTATMDAMRKSRGRNNRTVGVTVGPSGTRTFSLPSSCRYGPGLGGASPDGAQVITALGVSSLSCRRQRETVIGTHNGRSRSFRPPFGPLDELDGHTRPGFKFWGAIQLWDPFAPAIVGSDAWTGKTVIFDLRAGKDSKPMRVMPATSHGGRIDACFLPSGRVLFVGNADQRYWLAVTNAGRTSLAAIDTSRVGPISSASCDVVAGTGDVFLATADGRTYSAPASAFDGSALESAAG